MTGAASPIRRGAAAAAIILARLRPRHGKRVIVLHEISDPRRLREKIAWLVERYDVVPLSDLLHRPRDEKTQVAVTLDDGYRSWSEHAAPIFAEFAVPAVFFVCSGFVGLRGPAAEAFCAHRLRRRTRLDPLDLPELRALADHPQFEIGSHTVTHADLGALTDPAALEAEIGADRRRLEDWTGRRVRWFAYPFGQPENTSTAARRYLEEQAFDGACTIVPSFADGTDRLAVGRDSLHISDPVWTWQARLAGGYDGFYRLKRRLQSLT